MRSQSAFKFTRDASIKHLLNEKDSASGGLCPTEPLLGLVHEPHFVSLTP